jgi:exodeoxyribonuclease-3
VSPRTFCAATFNVNGIRARLPVLLDWLERTRPDVLCLQETKVPDDAFPTRPLEALGYQCVFRGEKGFNGVAVLSRRPVTRMRAGLDDGGPPDEARLLLVKVQGVFVLNTYVPQGTAPDSPRFQYKLQWFGRLRAFMDRFMDPHEGALWLGDFNVAPDPRDVYDPEGLVGQIGFHPQEHAALQAAKDWGWVDIFRRHVRDGGHYSFWDYRLRGAVSRGLGWRVDHIWATSAMAARSARCWIDVGPRRAHRPSDHAPVLAQFEI